jgi:hypothetical protein
VSECRGVIGVEWLTPSPIVLDAAGNRKFEVVNISQYAVDVLVGGILEDCGRRLSHEKSPLLMSFEDLLVTEAKEFHPSALTAGRKASRFPSHHRVGRFPSLAVGLVAYHPSNVRLYRKKKQLIWNVSFKKKRRERERMRTLR